MTLPSPVPSDRAVFVDVLDAVSSEAAIAHLTALGEGEQIIRDVVRARLRGEPTMKGIPGISTVANGRWQEAPRVEIKDIELPENMQRAMAREAEAERERRAKIVAAEGEYQAAVKLGEAADIIAEEKAREDFLKKQGNNQSGNRPSSANPGNGRAREEN